MESSLTNIGTSTKQNLFFRLVLLQVYIQVPQMTYTFFYLHQLESIPQQASVNVLGQNTRNT